MKEAYDDYKEEERLTFSNVPTIGTVIISLLITAETIAFGLLTGLNGGTDAR